LIPEAKRMTFDNGYAVRYRVNAPAKAAANFYRQTLASQGWRVAATVSPNSKLEKLIITYAENPISKKTDITYAYAPANSAVLGVKIAEADSSAPAPDNQLPAPMPDNLAPAPQQPPQSAPDQYQQPLSDGQRQPLQQPLLEKQSQPINQPMMNQTEFSRPPMQPFSGDQAKTQTCRVNGVDMPGSCEQYNNQNQVQTGQNGQINQDGQMGEPRQQGSSEEDQKKMDERRFKDMKKGLSQFASGAKMMKKNIARIKIANSKCGVGMPEELENALAQTDNLIGKINSAKTADELEEIVGDVQDVGSVMQDWGPRMGDLSRLCQMIKQADRDAKQFDRNVKRIEAQVKANKKVDLNELLAEYKTAVSAQKETLAQTKELAKTDPDGALAKIEDDFYGNMDNLGNLQMQIDTIVNITKGLRDITRELNTFASQIKTLTKKKVDTADMQELLNTLKTQVAEIKDLIKNKADAEELVSKVEETFDTRQELRDALQENDVINTAPKINAGSNYNIKVNLPEVFRKTESNNDNGETTNKPNQPAGTKF
ncbi:MAG: Argonaut-like protein, partial [Parcubacteria group bacterium GW2011_GWC2_42_12]